MTDQDFMTNESPAPRRPRWVRIFTIIGLILGVLVVLMLLVGGGDHGPGRHSGADEPPSGMTEHTAPEGGHG